MMGWRFHRNFEAAKLFVTQILPNRQRNPNPCPYNHIFDLHVESGFRMTWK